MCVYTYLRVLPIRDTRRDLPLLLFLDCHLQYADIYNIYMYINYPIHRPSSQGWAFRCQVIDCSFVCLIYRYVDMGGISLNILI